MTKTTHTTAPVSNTSPGYSSNTSPGYTKGNTEEGQDLMKFSLSPEDLAKLQGQRPHTVPASHRSHDPCVKSHDVRGSTQGIRLPGDINPKWDHFSSNSCHPEANFGVVPDQAPVRGGHKVGVATDTDHWAMLSLNGSEKVLGHNGLPLEGTEQTSKCTIQDSWFIFWVFLLVCPFTHVYRP